MKLYQKCPVCEGRGVLPAGFYDGPTSTSLETCRMCKGSGVITVTTVYDSLFAAVRVEIEPSDTSSVK